MARSLSFAFGPAVLGLLLVRVPVPAAADTPRISVAGGAGVALVNNFVAAAPEVAVGVRFRPRAIWYARAAKGTYDLLRATHAQYDGGMVEARTGPVWQTCWTLGCHGVGIELGWQRSYGTFADGATLPPEWSSVSHRVVFDARWRGELHLYGDGLVAVEASAGVRVQRVVHYAQEPAPPYPRTDTGKAGLTAGLTLIVRR